MSLEEEIIGCTEQSVLKSKEASDLFFNKYDESFIGFCGIDKEDYKNLIVNKEFFSENDIDSLIKPNSKPETKKDNKKKHRHKKFIKKNEKHFNTLPLKEKMKNLPNDIIYNLISNVMKDLVPFEEEKRKIFNIVTVGEEEIIKSIKINSFKGIDKRLIIKNKLNEIKKNLAKINIPSNLSTFNININNKNIVQKKVTSFNNIKSPKANNILNYSFDKEYSIDNDAFSPIKTYNLNNNKKIIANNNTIDSSQSLSANSAFKSNININNNNNNNTNNNNNNFFAFNSPFLFNQLLSPTNTNNLSPTSINPNSPFQPYKNNIFNFNYYK